MNNSRLLNFELFFYLAFYNMFDEIIKRQQLEFNNKL